MIFSDRLCTSCHGEGCELCHGTGIIGNTETEQMKPEELMEFLFPSPTEFGIYLREWRLSNGKTFRELSAETGITPGTLSEIEIGRREPTEGQRKIIEAIIR